MTNVEAIGRTARGSGPGARTAGARRTPSLPLRAASIADLAACCPPSGSDGVLDEAAAERLAAVLKSLAEPTRLRLMSLLASRGGAETCVCELTAVVGLSQPTVSHHLKVLVDAGLLEREQRGRWAYYRPVPGAIETLAEIVPGRATPQVG